MSVILLTFEKLHPAKVFISTFLLYLRNSKYYAKINFIIILYSFLVQNKKLAP